MNLNARLSSPKENEEVVDFLGSYVRGLEYYLPAIRTTARGSFENIAASLIAIELQPEKIPESKSVVIRYEYVCNRDHACIK